MVADLVIDADGHCQEPVDGLVAWLPPEYASRAPLTFKGRDGYTRTLIEGRLGARLGGLGSSVNGPFAPHIVRSRDGMRDPVQRLPDMDEEGIDVAVIFGTPIALTVNGLQDKGLAAAICHAVNRWLVEEYSRPTPPSEGRRPDSLPGPARRGEGAGVPGRQNGIVSAMLPDERLRHQSGRPPLRPDLRGSAGNRACRCRCTRRRATTASTAMGRDGRRDGADGEVCLRPHHGVRVRAADRAHAHDRRRGLRPVPAAPVAYMEGGAGWLPFWAERLDEHQRSCARSGRTCSAGRRRSSPASRSASPASRRSRRCRTCSSTSEHAGHVRLRLRALGLRVPQFGATC